MHPNEMPAREPMTKKEKLEDYLILKERHEKDMLELFTKGDISNDVYRKLLESSDKGYREFLTLLKQNPNKGQLDLDFKNI